MPRRTELDKPAARTGLAAKATLRPRASSRERAARGGSTTAILAGEKLATRARVLRSKVEERTRVNAFGRPSREENPAARITACSPGDRLPGRMAPFIGIMLP